MNIGDAILSVRSIADSRLAIEARVGRTAGSDDDRKVLRDFDSLFLSRILKGFHADDEENLFDGGSAGRMYRDQFYEEIARMLAEKGGLGLSEQLAEHLSKPGGVVEADASSPKKSRGGDE